MDLRGRPEPCSRRRRHFRRYRESVCQYVKTKLQVAAEALFLFGEQGFIFYKDVAVCIPPAFDGAAFLSERK